MVIHYTNIYNNVVFPDKKAYIFRFKERKSCANGDSVTLEFMICLGLWLKLTLPRILTITHKIALLKIVLNSS